MEKYFIWLTLALGFGNEKCAQLLADFESPKEIFAGDRDRYAKLEYLSIADRRALLNKDLKQAELILKQAQELGHTVLCCNMPQYPQALHEIYAKPIVLYIWGDVTVLSEGILVAVVGTRKMDVYGAKNAEKIGASLGVAGITVVTGMARGIDIMAHRGALSQSASTVGVLGCGLDIRYPAENGQYIEETGKTGVVISEYPYGTRPLPANFPVRNRIIAGLSRAVAVIQAPEKSGAMITATLACEQGKDVFALPGNIDEPIQRGTNLLIRDGAKAICGVNDICEEYKYEIHDKIKRNREKECAAEIKENPSPIYAENLFGVAQAAAFQVEKDGQILPERLTDTEKMVYYSLKNIPVDIDEIMDAAKTSYKDTATALTMLEMKGLIQALPQSRFLKI